MPPRPTRPWWQRLAALCLAVWFAVATADLPALHTCAMHGGAVSPAVAAVTGHAMHGAAPHDGAGAGQVAEHAHEHAHGGAPAHGGHGGHGGHVCTCLGACCGAAPAHVPPAPAALALAAPVVETPAAPGRPAHEYVAAWVDFVLPFSTAPPAHLTA